MEKRNLKINDIETIQPNDWTPQREDVYAAEITTCSGKTIMDKVGWKFSDTTISWDSLDNATLFQLAKTRGEATMVFQDVDGKHTESIVIQNFKNTATCFVDELGKHRWKDVQIEIAFLDVH